MEHVLRHFIWVAFFSLSFSQHIKAQVLQGVIFDYDNSKLEGAYVANIQTGSHAHTNINGEFLLKDVRNGDSIQISYLGNETILMVVIDISKTISIKMKQSFVSIDEVVITSGLKALNVFTNIDVQTAPVNTSQDIMRRVPGLFIGQHAGGGKAEQIFLRGFDIDHGTDIGISVDGMPVNMVSHAHGQGYADLHFLIPETVDAIDFGKGPYYAAHGNFTTAGYVSFSTKDRLENNLIKLDYGQFGTKRLLNMFNLIQDEKHSAYIASEFSKTDGPFTSSQNFHRNNIMAKYTGQLNNGDQISILSSYFDSKWDASGQIPERAVAHGSITRFGAIDDTEGGQTSRINARMAYIKNLGKDRFIKNSVYYSRYEFELFSNFTFFLNDAVNGDQIKQKEGRDIVGLNSEYNHSFVFGGHHNGFLQIGLDLRNDISKDNELSNTLNRRTTLSYLKLGNINEKNVGGYINSEFNFGKLSIHPAIRFDQFIFNYNDFLSTQYQTLAITKNTISPKLNLIYQKNNEVQFFLKMGKGFHSNDTRVITEQTSRQILPSAYGADLGAIFKPAKNILINTALWYLHLDQEFVYVGDAGIVEPSGQTRRQGIDLGIRYEPLKRLMINLDGTYTHAKALGEEKGNDFIPLAPKFTFVGAANYQVGNGITSGLSVRYLGDRAANEDYSIVAKGYTVVDFNVGYRMKSVEALISIQNLFNTEWNETQFATESRLQNEAEPVEEIHFTPGTPFFFKFSLGYRF